MTQIRMVLLPGSERVVNYGRLEIGKVYSGPLVTFTFVNSTDRKTVWSVPDPDGPEDAFGAEAVIEVTDVGAGATPRPPRTPRGHTRVTLSPGDSRTVEYGRLDIAGRYTGPLARLALRNSADKAITLIVPSTSGRAAFAPTAVIQIAEVVA
jgi:hypothetical protein